MGDIRIDAWLSNIWGADDKVTWHDHRGLLHEGVVTRGLFADVLRSAVVPQGGLANIASSSRAGLSPAQAERLCGGSSAPRQLRRLHADSIVALASTPLQTFRHREWILRDIARYLK